MKGIACPLSNKYNNYHYLSFAEFACEKDTNCIGIIDDNCDRDGPFQLCKNGYIKLDSDTISNCIYQKKNYQKKNYSGKLFDVLILRWKLIRRDRKNHTTLISYFSFFWQKRTWNALIFPYVKRTIRLAGHSALVIRLLTTRALVYTQINAALHPVNTS